ncbi:hypothetical protein D3C79_915580 [compost metagenome]
MRVEVAAFGDEHVITFGDYTPAHQFIDGALVHFISRNGVCIERDSADATEKGYTILGARITREREDGQMRANSRHESRGISGLGHADDCLHAIQMVGGIHRRHRDRLINAMEDLVHAVLGAVGQRMLFSAQNDAAHGLDGFDGIGARCRFG